MARMIPSQINKESPPGEQQVFRALAAAAGTEDWVVFHSFALSEHIRQSQGEADFVILVPDRGVLVVEVKSHDRILRREDGLWQFGNHPPVVRGPFQQADEAMFSIRRYLGEKGFDSAGCPLVSAAWFTATHARRTLPDSLEWQTWQILDQSDLADVAAAVSRTLGLGFNHLLERFPKMKRSFVQADVEKLTKLLRPRFELVVGVDQQRLARAQELISLVDEQYDALDSMSANRSVLFEGPAGTGKTLLAVEAARRETLVGKQGRLVCFNRKLGRSLRDSTEDMERLRAGTVHSWVLEILQTDVPSEVGPDTWDSLLESATERLLEDPGKLDYLIVDEAQDLVHEKYLDLFDLAVAGGLTKGRCLFFGDFDRQSIYLSGDGRPGLRSRMPELIDYVLQVNCRNLPRIGSAIEALVDMRPGYKRYRRMDDGAQPQYLWHASTADRDRQIHRAIRALLAEGFEPSEIIVLSPKRDDSAAALTRDPWLRDVLVEHGKRTSRSQVEHTTIHSFKGLEMPAVILTDLEEAHGDSFTALLYIGATRATDRLTIVGDREKLASRLAIK